MENTIEALKRAIENSETVVIGAGAGLSASAGFTYSGEQFEKHFSDFREKYGFADMYSGAFYPYSTTEEMWAFWSRNIYVNRYLDPPKPVYENLLKLVKDKDYFVITTNVDHCFQKAGFDKMRLFYTQGDYGLFQCSEPCHMQTYDNEQMVLKMLQEQKDMKIPTESIPRCPICGKPMSMNLRSDDTFVEDDGWHAAARRYEDFLRGKPGAAVVTLWRAGSTASLDRIHKYFSYSEMPIVSSTYWNMLHSGNDGFGEKTLRTLGENMADLVLKTAAKEVLT